DKCGASDSPAHSGVRRMKIHVNLSELLRLGKIMMPEGTDFTLERPLIELPSKPFRERLQDGVDIDIEDLDDVPGPFAVNGHQVLLYIKDHTRRFDEAVLDGARGNRFHLTHCQTLEEMKRNNRFQRY